MSKKRKKIIVITLAAILCAVLIFLAVWSLSGNATAYSGSKTVDISWQDSLRIRTALLSVSDFDGFSYEYGCGFSKQFSIRTGGLTFCLAQDDCNSVYIKEWDLYYCIHERSHNLIHEILSRHGISR